MRISVREEQALSDKTAIIRIYGTDGYLFAEIRPYVAQEQGVDGRLYPVIKFKTETGVGCPDIERE